MSVDATDKDRITKIFQDWWEGVLAAMNEFSITSAGRDAMMSDALKQRKTFEHILGINLE